MTADVDICNRALQAMGTRSTIASLSEISPEGQACALRYPTVRDRVLRAALWGCNKATANLALLKAAPGTPELPSSSATAWSTRFPAPPWLYAYAYPPDCLRFRGVVPGLYYSNGVFPAATPVTVYAPCGVSGDSPAVAWQRSTDTDANGNPVMVINCNVTQAIGVYSRQLLLPDSWDPELQAAVEFTLAAELAYPLSGDKTLRRENTQLARELIMQARTDDANEGLAKPDVLPDWLRVRNIGDSWGWSPNAPMLDPGYDSVSIAGVLV